MGNENAFSLKADLGIADVVRRVDEIFARRRMRKIKALSDLASNLTDDVDASSKIVKALDDTFTELIEGFLSSKIAQDPARLANHVEGTRKHLRQRELLPRLEECIGAIKTDSQDPRLKSKDHRNLVLALRSLASRLTLYRDNLGKGAITGVGQNEEWKLETLCERAQGCQYGGGKLNFAIEEIAEQVFRNHDFDVSDNIYRLVGTIRGHAKALGH